MAGNRPMAAAGACRSGLAWNAWAVMTMPIHSTMAMPASMGTTLAISRDRAGQADDRHDQAVEPRVARPGAERLPAGMADVDRGREATAEQGGGDRADAVDRQRRPGGEDVAAGLGRLDVLQAADHVEQAHGDDDRQHADDVGAVGRVDQELPDCPARPDGQVSCRAEPRRLRTSLHAHGHAGRARPSERRAPHASAVPSSTATNPPGRPSGNLTCEK